MMVSSGFAAAPDITGLGYQPQPGALLPLTRRFRTASGQLIDLRSAIADKPSLLILGYYACPSLCGIIRDDTLDAISQAGLVAGRDYRLIFLSIDAAETPAIAASAKSTDLKTFPLSGDNTAWVFLTGQQLDIDAVENAVGFHARYSDALKQFLHPAGLVIVSPNGRVSSYLLGVGFAPIDVKKALNEARIGVVEQPDNPVLLLCFHYDASVGRYSLDIIKVLRLAGVMTIVGISALVWLARRHARP